MFLDSGRILNSGRVFGIWEVFRDFVKSFWIMGRVLDSGKCFWILDLGRVLSLRATVCL